MIIYSENFTKTDYTLATKDFKITSKKRKLPDELAINNIEEVSKILGLNLQDVKQAIIKYDDGAEIEFVKNPIGGSGVVEIQGKKFYRIWSYRKEARYIIPEEPHITYRAEKDVINIYLVPVYGSLSIYEIDLPSNFPIDNWNTLAHDPAKEIFPNIPIKKITETKVTKAGTLWVRVLSGTKMFWTSIKKTKKHFEYRGIPFAEGVFNVRVPKGIDVNITKTMSIQDLPEEVKTRPKFSFVEETKLHPTYVEYDYKYQHYVFETADMTIHYWPDLNSVYIETPDRSYDFKDVDGAAVMRELLSKTPEEAQKYIRYLIAML